MFESYIITRNNKYNQISHTNIRYNHKCIDIKILNVIYFIFL